MIAPPDEPHQAGALYDTTVRLIEYDIGRLCPQACREVIEMQSSFNSIPAPAVHGTADKSGSRRPILGSGDFQFECVHDWARLPDGFRWKNTHGVAIDRDGLIYITHQGDAAEPRDTVLVFDSDGCLVRSFGSEYASGGHGIDIREEDGVEFLYQCHTVQREVIKTDLFGEWVWKLRYPRAAGVYRRLEEFRPTNVCFHPEGGFYVADGYGSHFIHEYDRHARWVRTFGGEGDAPGQLKTPHGLWLDDRPGREPSIVVADRAHARLQYFSLDGRALGHIDDVLFPANVETRGEVMLVSDLHARVSLFDRTNQPIVHLGDDPAWRAQVLANDLQMRNEPHRWEPGRFVHPHDACFDRQGNIFVTEWVDQGRVTFLKRA